MSSSEKDSELTALLSSASLVVVGSVISASAKLVERVIIGRALSPDAYGKVSIGLAILSFGVIVSMVGFTQGIPRYMSRFDDDENKRGVWVTGLGTVAVVSSGVVLVLLANLQFVHTLLFEGTDRFLTPFVFAIPLVAALRATIGSIRGFENTLYKTYVADLLYPVGRILSLVVFLTLGTGLAAAGYAYLLGATVSLVVGTVFLRRLLRLYGHFRTHFRELAVFSAPLVLSTMLSILLTKTDTVMLGYFRPSYEVGLYSAAYPLANGLLVVLSSFGFLYLPLASRLDSNGKREEIEDIYTLTTKWIYIITFPGFLAFVVFPEDVLAIFFGAEYARAGLALSVLSVGFFVNAAAGRNRETLSALGQTVPILLANSVAFVLNIGLNLALIPTHGYQGAAVASAVSFVLLNVTACTILKVQFDIAPLSKQTVRTFLVLPIGMIPPTYLLSKVVSLTVFTLPIFLVVSGVVGVFVVGIGNGLQVEDVIAIEFIEERIGIRIPFVRRFVPGNG